MIFVTGIHGVGKSVYSHKLAEQLDIPWYSASSIIRSLDSERIYPQKLVDTIDSNQQLLINGCLQLNERHKDYVLDGHVCLLNTNGEVEEINPLVFEAIGVKKLIIVVADAETIQKRVADRDKLEWSLQMIEDFQNREIKYAKHIADKLGVPFTIEKGE